MPVQSGNTIKKTALFSSGFNFYREDILMRLKRRDMKSTYLPKEIRHMLTSSNLSA